MNQKIILPDKKKDQQVRGQPIEFHIRNPRKRKYLFIDRKQIRHKGWGWGEELPVIIG